MKERPILFSAPMVRAILDGRKTQTRRAVKFRGAEDIETAGHGSGPWPWSPELDDWCSCPHGEPGDRLWVRETWGLHRIHDKRVFSELSPKVWYAADGALDGTTLVGKWRPSIHMPRWASRITLEVTGVRVERLHDITEEDALREGIERHSQDDETWFTAGKNTSRGWYADGRAAFRGLWDSINGDESWSVNPWVWVVEFTRLAGGVAISPELRT